MSNKGMIIRECEHLNSARRVLEGRIDCDMFFRSICGDLLITGMEAGNKEMVLSLVRACMEKRDVSTIVLTSHQELAALIQQDQNRRKSGGVRVSWPAEKNYHPFYGMSAQQMLRFVCMTAEEMGYSSMAGQVMIYAAAVLNIVSTEYPVSLPAVVKLLEEDDDFISELALQQGFSNVIADNIRANHEAGIVFRRLLERLEEIFENIYVTGSDTKYNLQSGCKEKLDGMVIYASSGSQRIFNAYLKEEIFQTLKDVPKIRILLDEMEFADENDELMRYIMQLKRQGRIELIVISQNVKESMKGNADLDFANVVLFQHGTPAATEEISKALFGTYQYHKPMPNAVKPPALLFTFQRAVNWQIQSEERLRVRSEDLSARPGIFGRQSDYLAVKTTANNNIYFIHTADFLKNTGYGLTVV